MDAIDLVNNPYFTFFIIGTICFGIVVFIVTFKSFIFSFFIPTFFKTKDSTVKGEVFECGTVGVNQVGQRFKIKFFLLASFFIIFDIGFSLLYLWAINVAEFGWNGFFAILTFLFLIQLSLLYAWRQGLYS